jgi:3-hydroxymyristoyl/3-hydroxydecanoyl-(acyl carrier protein) dehydratase
MVQRKDLKSIYVDNKSKLVVNSTRRGKTIKKRIEFREFKAVIKTYFEIKFNELFTFGHETDIRMPLISGYFTLRKMMQKRSFHTIKDNEQSKIQGKIVKVKIPVLDDWYSVLIWSKPSSSYKKLKVIFSKIVKDKKRIFVAEKGYDNIITKTLKA